MLSFCLILQNRAGKKRLNIIIVAEGAIDSSNKAITTDYIKDVSTTDPSPLYTPCYATPPCCAPPPPPLFTHPLRTPSYAPFYVPPTTHPSLPPCYPPATLPATHPACYNPATPPPCYAPLLQPPATPPPLATHPHLPPPTDLRVPAVSGTFQNNVPKHLSTVHSPLLSHTPPSLLTGKANPLDFV